MENTNTINLNYKKFVNEFNGMEAVITPAELKHLFSYVADMESNLKELTNELEKLSQKVTPEMKVQKNWDFQGEKESFAEELNETMLGFKDALLNKAGDIKQCVQERNIEALKTVLDKLKIKEFCEKIQTLLDKGLEVLKEGRKKLDFIGEELGGLQGHVKNLKTFTVGEAKKIEFSPIKRCFNATGASIMNMKEKTKMQQNRLDNLDKKVTQIKDKNSEISKEKISQGLRLRTQNEPMKSLQR